MFDLEKNSVGLGLNTEYNYIEDEQTNINGTLDDSSPILVYPCDYDVHVAYCDEFMHATNCIQYLWNPCHIVTFNLEYWTLGE
mmetsp:Transcript_28915/g.41998  ORF Transcript_28915/g.41998 Transcript_28915/m.41998 type:complete len:83 (+) Transcript_28915:72-320(+)